jgi:hypothetical protein
VNQSAHGATDTASGAGGSGAAGAPAGGATGGAGPLVQLKVDGDNVSSISYLDANGTQQTVTNPAAPWSMSFQANSSFQEKLRVRGSGSVKCTLTVGGSTSQNAGMSTGGTTVTCRGPVGN